MASMLLAVTLITVLLLNTKFIFGNTCDCDMVKDILTNEMLDLKVENRQLMSRIEKIELTMNAKTPMSSQSARIDTGRIEMMETRINAIELKVPDTKYSRNLITLQSLIAKALRSEKKERLKSELQIAAGLKKIDDSLKAFKVKSDAIFASHINNTSDRIWDIKRDLSENISHVRNEVMAVSNNVVKLANQTSFLIENNITTIEMSMEAMNLDVTRIDANIKTLVDVVLQDRLKDIKNALSQSIIHVKNDVSAITYDVAKLANETHALLENKIATMEMGADMDAMNDDFSKMDADITAIIDIVLLEQNAKCIPNCTNGGVCFRNNTCKCKPFTEGPHCAKVICEDKCYENGGKCIGPGICKCPEDRQGSNCEEQDHCHSSPCYHGHCSSNGENFKCECPPGYTGALCEYDCFDVLRYGGNIKDGIYTVRTWKNNELIKVYCDMTTDGGGWTVFQYRFNGSVDFYRNFYEYEHGFGNLKTEFWLGLRHIEELASQGLTDLRIDLEAANGTTGFETFDNFSLSPGPAYTLHLGPTIASSQISSTSRFGPYHNGHDFTTKDNDADSRSRSNCAVEYHGAWWYNDCYDANLNGKYLTPGSYSTQSMNYKRFLDLYLTALKSSKMMIRRK